MRRKLIVAGGALAALIAVIIALLLGLDANQFRGRVQAELQKRLRRPVSLGVMGLRLIPLAIRAADVSIGESPAFQTGRPFATARHVRVRVGLLPLLRKQVQVESFVLDQPEIELVRNAAGKWNYTEMGAGGQGGGGALELTALDIADGQLAVSELGKPASRSVYEHIDLSLRDFAPGRTFRVEGKLELPPPKGGSIRLSATGGEAAYSGQLTLASAALGGLMRLAGSGGAAALDGKIDGTLDFESAGLLLKGHSKLTLKDLQSRNAAFPYPVRLECQLTRDAQSGVVDIPSLTLEAGKLPLRASGRIDTKASAIDATASIARAGLDEILAMARALGVADASGKGTLSLNMHVKGPLDRIGWSGAGALENATVSLPAFTKPLEVQMAKLGFDRDSAALNDFTASLGNSTVRGKLAVEHFAAPAVNFALEAGKLDLAEIQQISASGSSTPASGGGSSNLTARGTLGVGTLSYGAIVLNRVRSECTFANGVLKLAPVTAEVFGGSQSGNITLDTRQKPPRLALDMKMDGVDADRLLSATTSVKRVLYGLLAASGDASMNLAPGADSARSLNGNLNIRLNKGRLAGVNLLNEMAGLAKFLGYAARKEPFTDIVRLAGDIRIRDGVANTDNLQLDIDGGSISSAGTINLVDQSLNLRLTTVLDRDTSQKVGGNKIGGFLSTALAGPGGELVIPAIVSGTFAKPRFLPDGARVAEMKLKSLVPGLGNAKAGANTGANAGGGLMNLIDALRGKGRKEEKK